MRTLRLARRASTLGLLAAAAGVAVPGAAKAARIDLTGPATTYDLAVDSATTRIDGPVADAAVGRDVALADVNGDGTQDIAVTEGADVRVVFGPAGSIVDLASLVPRGFVITGGQGGQVDAVGDVNGDGLDDLAVRTRTTDYRVVLGQAGQEPVDVSASPGETGFPIRTAEAYLQIAAAGDVNGDGLDDIVLKEGAERAFVVFGKGGRREADLDALGSGGFELLGGGRFFNGLVGAAGDVDGDGLADVLVSDIETTTPDPAGPLLFAGTVYVVFGKRSSAAIPLYRLAEERAGYAIVGTEAYGFIGTAVANAGDVNLDGVPDQLVGMAWRGTGPGSVAVVFGKRASTSTIRLDEEFRGYEIRGPHGGSIGYAVAGDVDVNGDGRPDQVLGDAGARRGAVHVVLGKRNKDPIDLDTASDVIRIEGPANGSSLGSTLAALSLRDGPQALLGAPGADPNGSDAGSAYLVDDGLSRPIAAPPFDLLALDSGPERRTAGTGSGPPTLTLRAIAPLSLELELLRLVPGKRVGPKRQRCVAPARAGARDRPCVRPRVARRASISLAAPREVALPLRGRLPAGAYVVSVRITDQAGRLHGPYRAAFRVAP